jgi:hypothetical protein
MTNHMITDLGRNEYFVQHSQILILSVFRKFLYVAFGRHVKQILQGRKRNAADTSNAKLI